MPSNLNIKLPNFLIVGAAKAGTTSLYHYLKEHPEIYMSPVKEPKFITAQFLKFPFKGIGDDFIEKSIIKNFDDYKNLFSKAQEERAIGEASADNLYYYKEAIPIIKKYLNNPKIIIILRNPIDRAFSSYTHLLRDNRETLSFEDALQQEEKRKKMNWEFIWYYKDVGFYYKQVKAYLQNFSNVKIYLYDDFKKDTLKVVKDIYKFLGVNPTFTPNIHVKYNVSLVPKYKFIHNFIEEPNLLKKAVNPIINRLIPRKLKRNLVDLIKKKNLTKPKMKPETREYLKTVYKEDILKLQDLIGKDLSHWLE